MKALVYHGPAKKTFEDRPMPQISDPTDAIVRIVRTTICGTDLMAHKLAPATLITHRFRFDHYPRRL